MVAGRAVGVHGAEDEHAEARELERELHRLVAAELADQDHVGVLAAGAADGARRSSTRAAPTSRWVTCAFARLVHELDRILDREDVAGARAVDVVDHRRERGRLAGAGRPGDEHEARAALGELADGLRAAEIARGVRILLGMVRKTAARPVVL